MTSSNCTENIPGKTVLHSHTYVVLVTTNIASSKQEGISMLDPQAPEAITEFFGETHISCLKFPGGCTKNIRRKDSLFIVKLLRNVVKSSKSESLKAAPLNL